MLREANEGAGRPGGDLSWLPRPTTLPAEGYHQRYFERNSRARLLRLCRCTKVRKFEASFKALIAS